MTLTAYIEGIGLTGPGLANWPGSQAVLSGQISYQPANTLLPPPALLPTAERRRSGAIVKLTLATGLEATNAAGLIDAAVVGGVDSLCLTTLYGFNSLGLVSEQPCRPYDAQRNGLSIGEAAAFALLERIPQHASENLSADAVLLLGAGESSDAYHMSSPHPEGRGARMAMQEALNMAGLQPTDIDYINLHGTATQNNDAAEGCVVSAVFGSAIPCSSTKGATGHTLGAAGGLEAVICALALQHGLLPAGLNTQQIDPSFKLSYLLHNREQPVARVLSNSFGFGGTNCSLIFGRADSL